jgi:hypothetical protein
MNVEDVLAVISEQQPCTINEIELILKIHRNEIEKTLEQMTHLVRTSVLSDELTCYSLIDSENVCKIRKLSDVSREVKALRQNMTISDADLEAFHTNHIRLLHDYNDIKDAGQMIIGKLAEIKGVTVHAHF